MKTAHDKGTVCDPRLMLPQRRDHQQGIGPQGSNYQRLDWTPHYDSCAHSCTQLPNDEFKRRMAIPNLITHDQPTTMHMWVTMPGKGGEQLSPEAPYNTATTRIKITISANTSTGADNSTITTTTNSTN